MSDTTLRDLVLARIEADTDPEDEWAALILAALGGPDELGSLLDEGPSKLYDALSKVLGLDALVDAQAALQQARSARDNARKEADQDRQALRSRLADVEDERA